MLGKSIRWLAMIAGVAVGVAAHADVTIPPPLIQFENWTKLTETTYETSFPSSFATEHAENNRVKLRIRMPAATGSPAPTVIILHYWGARDLRNEERLAQELNLRGVAAILMTLPYHLERTPPGLSSGELAILPDPDKLVATMTQSVADVRRTIDFIQSRPEFEKGAIGISGTSLGSLIATLVYAIDTRVQRANFMLGGVDLAYIFWHSSRVVEQRDALRRKGYTEAKLREELKAIEPLEFLKPDDRRNAFVIGARFDTVVPRASTERLIEHLDNPRVLWLETGHYGGFFVQGRIQKEIAAYFQKELRGEAYQAPRKIYAPTVRLGVQVAPESGLDIGAGIDFWRNREGGDIFANAFFTPRGPQLFIGKSFDRSVSFGISIAPQRTTVGLLWSVVL